MRKHLKYLSYVLRHKWFVFLELRKLGKSPWLGIIHDLSKFRPSEWLAYANHFYGSDSHHEDGTHTPVRDKTGYYKPTDTGDPAFDLAWHYHQRRNAHHWQFWVQADDSGGEVVLQMPHRYFCEMLCDWRGASRAQGSKSTVAQWYEANKGKMRLHPITRRWVEASVDRIT